jgi:DNA processing protein
MNMSTEDILFLREVNGLGFQRLRFIVENDFKLSDLANWKKVDWQEVKGISFQKTYDDFHKKYNQPELRKRIFESIKIAEKTITFWDKNYPIKLKQSSSPPLILFLEGNIDCFNRQQIAIVGSRVPSLYGKTNCKNFSKLFIDQKLGILSGFARGIDTIAHQTAVDMSSETIAVMGTSLDIIYPNENKALYGQILNKNGLIVSEYLMQTKPDAKNFPKRNRIIASLAEAVIVMEAGERSGAIITAEMAFKEKTKVFAIPGNIDSKQSKGTNYLIKNGIAEIALNPNELLDSFNIKAVNTNNNQVSFIDFSRNEEDILQLLSSDPIYIDRIAEKLKKQPYEILADILNLELKQCIRKLEGNYFIKTL